ncbi:MAG: hypothetical protein FJZ01_24295 [Candidatus Sericytochromatia bacterium]|nr:hypothetical protein [Candidatus Tanganyikabacteria bacterium]
MGLLLELATARVVSSHFTTDAFQPANLGLGSGLSCYDAAVIELFLTATPSVDLALAGYSGLFNVPTATVVERLSLAYRWLEAPKRDLLLSPPNTGFVNRDYVASLPLLPFVEVTAGALSVSDWPDPGFPHLPNGFHRALSAKLRLPLYWQGPALAIGTVDPLSANAFNGLDTGYGLANYYIVATQRWGPFALTGGWGAGDRKPNRYARSEPFLDGFFYGLQWALPFGIEFVAEWDARSPNAGLRWVSPFGFSLAGASLGGGYTAGAGFGLDL